MTWNRDKSLDRAATQRLLFNPQSRAEFEDVEPNWLGHKEGSAAIDWDLLDGAPMSQLLNHRKTVAAVKKHLDHLEDDHGLKIDRTDFFRFTRDAREGVGKTNSEIIDDSSRTTKPAPRADDAPMLPLTELDVPQTDQVSEVGLELKNHVGDSVSDFETGAGFGDSAENKLVESAAVRAVVAQYMAGGWLVRSVERDKCGFDLECVKSGVIEQVEVKGVQGSGLCFIITAGEVKQAQNNPKFYLIIVTSALAESPTLTKFTGKDFLRQFDVAAIQYRAAIKPSLSSLTPECH